MSLVTSLRRARFCARPSLASQPLLRRCVAATALCVSDHRPRAAAPAAQAAVEISSSHLAPWRPHNRRPKCGEPPHYAPLGPAHCLTVVTERTGQTSREVLGHPASRVRLRTDAARSVGVIACLSQLVCVIATLAPVLSAPSSECHPVLASTASSAKRLAPWSHREPGLACHQLVVCRYHVLIREDPSSLR